MAIREILFAIADLWMIAIGFTYGTKFIHDHGNHLLGIEWIIMGTSGTNFLIFALTGADHHSPMYYIAYFLDAFSRSIGFTLILVLGLMKVTHHYKPSATIDTALFALAAAAGFILFEFATELGTPGKAFFLATATLTSTFLIDVIRRLWTIGEHGHATWMAIATISNMVIAATYDFVQIPGDDSNRTLFYTSALATWGLAMLVIYQAYQALSQHNNLTDAATTARAPDESRNEHHRRRSTPQRKASHGNATVVPAEHHGHTTG